MLPFVISKFQKDWPLNILEAHPSGAIAPPDWQAKVVAPVGSGDVRFGHIAVNLIYENEPIVAEFETWLDQQREMSGFITLPKPNTFKGGRDTLRQLAELKYRSGRNRANKTFEPACKIDKGKRVTRTNLVLDGKKSTYYTSGDSSDACEAAIKGFAILFKTTELPIHADWRSCPKRKSSLRTMARSRTASPDPSDAARLRVLDWSDSILDKAVNLRIGDLVPDDQGRGHEIVDMKISPSRVRQFGWNTNGEWKEVNMKSKSKVRILSRGAEWVSYGPDQWVRRSRRADDAYA